MRCGLTARAAGLAALAALTAVASGCSAAKVVEVRTDPSDALVSWVDGDGTVTRVGAAPVRFEADTDAAIRVIAEAPDHARAEAAVPEGDLEAFVDVVLVPIGPALDRQKLLEALLGSGPTPLFEAAGRVGLDATRARAAALGLVERGEAREVRPGVAKDGGGLDAVYDIELRGVARLEAAVGWDLVVQRLLAGRRQLERRAARAERRAGRRR